MDIVIRTRKHLTLYTELITWVPVTTPFGPGFAMAVIDYGQEHHLLWVVALDSNGEVRVVANPDIRVRPNESMRAPRGP